MELIGVLFVLVVFGFVLHKIPESFRWFWWGGMPMVMTSGTVGLSPVLSPAAMSRAVTAGSGGRMPKTRRRDRTTGGTPTLQDVVFDKHNVENGVPNPTDLLKQGPLFPNKNGRDKEVTTSEVSVVDDDNFGDPALMMQVPVVPGDVQVNGSDFHAVISGLAELSSNLIGPVANRGSQVFSNHDLHMRLDLSRRILGEATRLVNSSRPRIDPNQPGVGG